MTILTIVGIIVLIALLFVGGGLLGWLIKGVEVIFSFLLDGCGHTLGCLLWIFLGICLIIVFFG